MDGLTSHYIQIKRDLVNWKINCEKNSYANRKKGWKIDKRV